MSGFVSGFYEALSRLELELEVLGRGETNITLENEVLKHRFTQLLPIMWFALAMALGGCEENPPPAAETPSGPAEIGQEGEQAIQLELGDLADEADFESVERGAEGIRRLTRDQFTQAVKSLLGEGIVVPAIAEPDVTRGGLRAIGASSVTYTPRGVESVESAALNVAAQALGDSERRAGLISCTPGDVVDDACAREVLTELAARAWRRPVSDDEIEPLLAVVANAARVLEDFYRGLEYGIAAILQSPHFLFRVEVGHADGMGEQRELTAYEMASRLSFFLWNTPPDEALRDAAASGALLDREGLFFHANRLLEDPRSRPGLRALFLDHLKLYELDHLKKDPTVFEHFNDRLGEFAREETLKLIENLVFDAPGDFRELMTSRVTFINPMLASIYQVPSPVTEGFGRVELPEEVGRAGLLGHVSFLAAHSHARASSATRRGVAVRTILLCQTIPSPPVDVDTSIPEPSAEVQTLRDRVAEHLENPSCAGCHALTDPIGLGLENFDGIGRYRVEEYGTTIDPAGALDGDEFVDSVGLGRAIRDHRDFVPCVVKIVSRYATGRLETRDEAVWIRFLTERFRLHGYQLKPLILEFIMSPLFREIGGLKEAE